MTDINEILTFLNDDKLTASIVFGTKNEDKQNVPVVTVTPTKTVVKSYAKVFQSIFKLRKDRPIINYSATDSEPTEILRLSKEDIPNIEQYIKKPTKDTIDEDDIKHTTFTAFHLQNSELKEAVIFREYKSSPFLSKKRRDRLTFSNHVLDFAKKDSITVTRKVDCILFNDEFLILRRRGFEKIFDFRQVYKVQSDKLFSYFENESPYKIEGLAEFKENCIDLDSLRRVSNIFSQKDFKKITLDKIKTFSEKNPDLNIKVNETNQEVSFGDLKKMLYFLDQAYYTYDTTGNRFTALLKKKRN